MDNVILPKEFRDYFVQLMNSMPDRLRGVKDEYRDGQRNILNRIAFDWDINEEGEK